MGPAASLCELAGLLCGANPPLPRPPGMRKPPGHRCHQEAILGKTKTGNSKLAVGVEATIDPFLFGKKKHYDFFLHNRKVINAHCRKSGKYREAERRNKHLKLITQKQSAFLPFSSCIRLEFCEFLKMHLPS